MERRVLLVCAPWQRTEYPSLQLGILKSVLREAGVKCDVAYTNFDFSKIIGSEYYSYLSSSLWYSYLNAWVFNEFMTGKWDGSEKPILDLLNINRRNPITSSTNFPSPEGRIISIKQKLREDIIPGQAHVRNLLSSLKKIREESIPEFLDHFMERTNWPIYDIVGFTCSLFQIVPSLSCAYAVKLRYPDKFIVLGGNEVSGHMSVEYMRVFDFLDYICYGEGETVFPNLVDFIRNNERFSSAEYPAGITYRTPNGNVVMGAPSPPVDVNLTPLPDYDDYYAIVDEFARSGQEFENEGIMYETSRGCWWGECSPCKFCGLNGEHVAYRYKNENKILGDLRYLSKRYPCREIRMADNIVSIAKHYRVFEALKAENLGVSFFYEAKPSLNREELQLLKDANITQIQVGIETFSTELQRMMNKGSHLLETVRFLKYCKEIGIKVSYNFLIGIPGERKAHYEKMLELIPSLVHLCPPSYPPTPITLQRYSEYFVHPAENEIDDVRPCEQYEIIFPKDRVCTREIAVNFSFNMTYPSDDTGYLQKIAEAIRLWNVKFHSEKRSFFDYEKDAGAIVIFDSRFENAETSILEGILASIVEFCNDIKSTREIFAHISSIFEERYDFEETRVLTDELVSAKILLEENGRYLNLACKKTALPDSSNHPKI